jgi:hypothetical protein
MDPQTKQYKSVRFRYTVADERQSDLEDQCRRLINTAGCSISDFRDYPILEDLGGDRHLEEPRTAERRQRRAQLVVEDYCSIAKLILDALIGPDSDGRYCLPHHRDPDPQRETPFRVLHHVFCNATNVPLYITTLHHVPGDSRRPPQHEVQFLRVFF